MDKWFKSKWFVRVISLAFAILLFVFVNVEANTTQSDSRFIPGASEEMETVDEVPLDIRMDEEKFVVSGVPEYVSVSLEGTNSILTPTVRQRNFKAYVNLDGLGEGEHTVEVEHENVPNGLSVYIEPKTIDVTLEERETKEFNVNVDFINTDQLTDGYELGDPVVDPETITITSSKSVIKQIAMVKVFVDVAGLTDSVNKREVPVNVYDNQGNELNVHVEPENVLVSADVDNPSKTVAVNVATKGELPDGYKLTSLTPDKEELTLYGTNSTLDDINDISTEEIDLSEMEASGTVDLGLALPDGVKADEDKIKVTIKIEQTKEEEASADSSDKKKDEDPDEEPKKEPNDPDEPDKPEISDITLKDIPIDIINVPGGQDVSFVTPGTSVMDVTVEGEKQAISKLTADNLRTFIDVAGLEEGEHTVPLIIEGPDDANVSGELNEVTVEITSPVDE